MPYINREKREDLDKVVDLMTYFNVKADGDLNYILYSYFVKNFKMSYNVAKNYRAELMECAVEIGRRLLGPYEDEKIKINGDVK